MGRMNSIELFGCAGGMAEGFRRAGIRFGMVFDFDPNACNSYEANMGHRPIQIDVRDLLRMAELGWRPPDPIDLLVADPPCTPWSHAGKRKGTDDDRDMLLQTIRLIEILAPTAYVIGNVPGLDNTQNMAEVMQPALSGLSRIGYCTADFVRLNAADFGVPQMRIRPFWFGHRGGQCIRWPVQTHVQVNGSLGIDQRKPWVTCRDALSHLSADELGRPVRLRWKHNTDHRPSAPDEPAKTTTTNSNSDGALLADPTHSCHPDRPARVQTSRSGRRESILMTHPRHPNSKIDEPARTVTAQAGGGVGGARVLEWPWDRPSTTVTQERRIAGTGHHGHGGQYDEGIVMGEKARAILQGFPESWTFSGKTKKARDSQIGQAMPPPLAHAVGSSVFEWFSRRLETPVDAIAPHVRQSDQHDGNQGQ